MELVWTGKNCSASVACGDAYQKSSFEAILEAIFMVLDWIFLEEQLEYRPFFGLECLDDRSSTPNLKFSWYQLLLWGDYRLWSSGIKTISGLLFKRQIFGLGWLYQWWLCLEEISRWQSSSRVLLCPWPHLGLKTMPVFWLKQEQHLSACRSHSETD